MLFYFHVCFTSKMIYKGLFLFIYLIFLSYFLNIVVSFVVIKYLYAFSFYCFYIIQESAVMESVEGSLYSKTREIKLH